MTRALAPALIVLSLAACGSQPPLSNPPGDLGKPTAATPEVAAPVAAAPRPAPAAVTVAALDTTTAAQKHAALAAPVPAPDAALGRMVVSLGSATEPGLWLRTDLVKTARPGTVQLASGKSAAVELRPGEGAPQLSLPAYLALGLNLTDLPEVTIYGR